MGTFIGHALPGTFFLVFAIWWTVQIFRRYYQCMRKTGEHFVCTVTFPCTCLCTRLRKWEFEGFMKLFFAAVGLIGEIITGYEGGKFVHMGNGQHATIFIFFGLSGVVDLMVHHRVPLPKGIDYVMMTLSFVVEGLMFKFHLHGRTDMDVLVHMLLLYTVYANALACLLEMRFRKNVLSALARTFFLFIQGTWFWHVGFILYNPVAGAEPWDEADHTQMMLITMMFAWHMGAVFLTMLAIGAFIGCIYRCRGDFDYTAYNSLQMQLIKKDANGQTVINLHDDSESDIEFERPLGTSTGH